MKKLLKKIALFVSPVLLITACYFITDPFQDLPWHQIHAFNVIMLSRGDISTKLYLKNRESYHYNSFIFGSSRSTAHTATEWKKYLPAGSVAFSFGAWNESVKGIYRRLKLIDSLKENINEAFIVLDTDHSFNSENIEWDHYLITKTSPYDYYKNHYLDYLQNPRLILSSIDYQIFKKQRGYMADFVSMEPDDFDTATNDWEIKSEQKILKDTAAYYNPVLNKFYSRAKNQQYTKPLINDDIKSDLLQIKAILAKHRTRYKIIIAPLYDQLKLNAGDFVLLKLLFGEANVFDYSGINSITTDKYNYGNDVIHYRKKVGALIFKQVYLKSKNK